MVVAGRRKGKVLTAGESNGTMPDIQGGQFYSTRPRFEQGASPAHHPQEVPMAIRRRWLVLAVAVTTLVLVAIDRLMPMYWVGHTDLEVEFAVVGGDGNLVEGAEIDIQSEGGFYEGGETESSFTLRTDAEKLARVIYDGRAFDLMGQLADALEETGCEDR